MASINLLDWREDRRDRRKKEFITVLVSVVVVCGMLLFLSHMVYESWIDGQRQRNNYLKNEISILDRQIREIRELEDQRRKLEDRMNVIQKLQSSRPQVVRLFDELVRVMPDGVYVTKIERKGKKIFLEGRAESNTRVSRLMRNIDESDWLDKPVLSVIREAKGGQGGASRQFRLTLTETFPAEQNNEEGS